MERPFTRTLAIRHAKAGIPGVITGLVDVCEEMMSSSLPGGTIVTYSINKLQDALSYNWSVPPTATIVGHPGGAGTNNDTLIQVIFSPAFTSGLISVSANNGCGTGLRKSLPVKMVKPIRPGVITGPNDACPFVFTGSLAT